MPDWDKLLKNIIEYYKDLCLKDPLSTEYKREDVEGDWWKAFKYFIRESFMQYRGSAIANKFSRNVFSELEKKYSKEEILITNWQDVEDVLFKIWDENQLLKKKRESKPMGRRRDMELISKSLALVQDEIKIPENFHHNVVNFAINEIKERRIDQLFKLIDPIPQVGDKTGRLFIRDITLLFEYKPRPEDYEYISPIDRYILQFVGSFQDVVPEFRDLPDIKKPKCWPQVRQKLKAFGDRIGLDDCRWLDLGIWYFGYWVNKNNSMQVLHDLFSRFT